MAGLNIHEIQILALASIEDPDWKAQYRKICRWYSKEFCTPLQTVELDLDHIHVLTHYYESSLGTLYDSQNEGSQERYEEIKDNIINGFPTEEEAEEADQEDDDWARQLNEDIRRDEEERKAKQAIKAKEVKDIKSLESPNLEEEVLFSMQGESGRPNF